MKQQNAPIKTAPDSFFHKRLPKENFGNEASLVNVPSYCLKCCRRLPDESLGS